MTQRYQHVPDQLRRDVANKLGQMIWGIDHGEGDDSTDGRNHHTREPKRDPN